MVKGLTLREALRQLKEKKVEEPKPKPKTKRKRKSKLEK
tara:strand:+ start:2176 stop:2292 length:117 start_codon:yes stop_codon:yes gene_type:complete